MGVRGNIKADRAAIAKAVVHKKMLVGGGENDVADDDLAEADIDATSSVKNTAHELHQWPVGPMPEQEVTNAKHLQEMEDMLVEGTCIWPIWPDGNTGHSHGDGPLGAQPQPDSPDRQASDKDEGGGWQIQSAIHKLRRNLASSLSAALKTSCKLVKLGYPCYTYRNADSLYVRLWCPCSSMSSFQTCHTASGTNSSGTVEG